MEDRTGAEVIRQNRTQLARAIAYDLAEEYRFLEFCDIFDWKRTRAKK
jgi:hypothetical protein